jgi:hypothetical protein
MVENYKRGHEYIFDEENLEEYYVDNHESTENERPCTKCEEIPTLEGHDVCLRCLLGVDQAFYGHGKKEGYIRFKNELIIRGEFRIEKKKNNIF